MFAEGIFYRCRHHKEDYADGRKIVVDISKLSAYKKL
jgi:hypothetical protein